ncbi:hypothetical protein D3C80_2018740 [compost metagenome]
MYRVRLRRLRRLIKGGQDVPLLLRRNKLQLGDGPIRIFSDTINKLQSMLRHPYDCLPLEQG